MSDTEIKEIYEENANLWHELKKTNDEYEECGRDPLTSAKMNNMFDMMDNNTATIDKLIYTKRPGLDIERKAFDDEYDRKFTEEIRARALKAMPIPYSVGDANHGASLVGSNRMIRMIENAVTTCQVMRQICSIEYTSTSTLDFIVDSTNFTLSPTGWALEHATAGSATPNDASQVTKLSIPTYEMYVQPLATQKLLQDTNIDFSKWLANKAAYSFADAEEQAFLLGNGTDRPLGLLSYPISTSTTPATGTIQAVLSGVDGGLTTDSIVQLYYSLSGVYAQNMSFLMHPTMIAQIRLLKDTTGQYIWQPAYSGGKETLMGVPVYCSSYVPIPATGSYSVIFGDFKRATVIVNRLKSMTFLPDPFTFKPLIAFYITTRVGFGVINTNGLKLLKLGTS